MNYFRQIIYEMRHQRMMTWVAVSGTALSIFLVMAFYITENMVTVDHSPESSRSRVLSGRGIHVNEGEGYDSSGFNMTLPTAEEFYADLDGIETISYVLGDLNPVQLSLGGEEPFVGYGRCVDAEYWKIFDFKFIHGGPFIDSRAASSGKAVILSRSAARRLFKEDDVVGRKMEINMRPYYVVGVVEDISPLLSYTYADFFTALDKEKFRSGSNDYGIFGNFRVLLKMKHGVHADDIKRQVKERYSRKAQEYKKEGKQLFYHDQPYTAEENALDFGSNFGPDMKGHRRTQWIIYAILLLLPAINLGSMTRSRLRHRVAEIGVRRAFGANRLDIITQLIGENFLITCVGGIIGFILSFIFLLLASHLFFQMSGQFETILEVLNGHPDLIFLIRWQNFLFALLLCFILNIVSATVPALRASGINPAEAISKSR